MMRILLLAFLIAPAQLAQADTVLAAQTIRPQTILTAEHLVIKEGDTPGAASQPVQVIGQEARVALYAGRPIQLGDLGPPAVVDRNQIVPILFISNGLTITAEGRALERAGAGEFVRVMNLSSRTTIMGLVMSDGWVMVNR